MTTWARWGDRQTAAGDRLAELSFKLQHVEMAGFDHVEVAALEPFLRGLVFTDGTVTRALEVHTLSPVAVDVVDQSPTPLPAQAASDLDASASAECLRRRVMMRTGDATVTVWAESYILPERLPTGFVDALDSASQGIGQSMLGLRLESRRELLWFRLGPPPRWARTATPSMTALIRCYRIITEDQPALLITETFAVEKQSGLYGLLDVSDGAVDAANGAVASQCGSNSNGAT